MHDDILAILRCPTTGEPLVRGDNALRSCSGSKTYPITASGIPLFAQVARTKEALRQQEHYDRIAGIYLENLAYPHTQEYMHYLDRSLLKEVDNSKLDMVAEVCCGHGEAFQLLGPRVNRGIGIDISLGMLEAGRAKLPNQRIAFVQADATALPIADASLDSVFTLGGIHHVNDRVQLFSEIYRALKPGGRFYWREPVSDFFAWRWLRAVIYRLSPTLDSDTERPLRHCETAPYLQQVGFHLTSWRTYGFVGFCLLMNSDVLVFNRLFRFIPGIRAFTRLMTRVDDLTTKLPGLGSAGLQVVGVAERPAGPCLPVAEAA